MVLGSCAGHLSPVSLFTWTTSYQFFFLFATWSLLSGFKCLIKMCPEYVWFVFCLNTKRCGGWTAARGGSGNNLTRSVDHLGRTQPSDYRQLFFFFFGGIQLINKLITRCVPMPASLTKTHPEVHFHLFIFVLLFSIAARVVQTRLIIYI